MFLYVYYHKIKLNKYIIQIYNTNIYNSGYEKYF